ncbi:HK97 gp10 family phage protein [Peptoniphilus sp. BV3C26]|uniref:HK97 gp10 family phage protein n=1 Tax=Peptoniphilus sp. BV3C26 TaxID=1111134 RepID=UPI0003B89957|nr:HK97 gp10 family phage protein [Peptoniphilus sp. BV3C26]ERT57723.1 tail protein, HK97 family [Peptoniphilus sp. BV3C26]
MSIDLVKEIEKATKEQLDLANDVVNKAVDKVAKETVSDLKSSSPKKSGEYASGWGKREGQTATRSKSSIVWNEEHYRLTHLLEFGHAKVNGGRVAAKPHIAAVEQKAIKNFEDELKRGIEHG